MMTWRSLGLAAGACALIACGGRDGHPSPADGAVTPTDAAVGEDAPPVLRRHHYSACTSDAQCPVGDVCQYVWPSMAGPVPSPPPRTMCRPPCTTADDCPDEATAGGSA